MDTIKTLELQKGIMIHAFTVPHRDEFSETAGFKIVTEKTSYLFIPDIDKWTKWNKNIIEEVKKVNYAFVDATFNEITELKNRFKESFFQAILQHSFSQPKCGYPPSCATPNTKT